MGKSSKIVAVTLLFAALLQGCQYLWLSDGPNLPPRTERELRIATYNVHYILLNEADGLWGLSGWQARKGPLDATFKAMEADIVAFQEMESFAGGDDDSVNLARKWLLENNDAYAAAAIGDWREFPSTQPIFYRRERFELTNQGWFFFSGTPEAIYSRTFDGSYPAFASWAAFRDRRNGAQFRVVNIHLDYASRENRRRSTALIAERIGPWIAAGETVFLAGDMNARLGSRLHRMLEAVGLNFVAVQGTTYHFGRGVNLFGAIDHIGYAGNAEPLGTSVVLREKSGSVWPTDHYPVVVDFVSIAR